jgi:hypothetical protein
MLVLLAVFWNDRAKGIERGLIDEEEREIIE